MQYPTLNEYLTRTGITAQRSGDGLILFDYNKVTQFANDWDAITLNARGIVFEEATGKCIARPYSKFSNLEEFADGSKLLDILPKEYLPNLSGPFVAMDKMDGSLGICYYYNGQWRVNTRGSFNSDQAKWATERLRSDIKFAVVYGLDSTYTHLFEIIYPENKIVVDYGDTCGLYLHGLINPETGFEVSYVDMVAYAKSHGLLYVSADEFACIGDIEAKQKVITYNKEGWVVRFANGFRCKMKGAEYVKLHRAVSYITPLAFWEMIDPSTRKIPLDKIASFPEEFRVDVDALVSKCEVVHSDLYEKIQSLASTVPVFDNDAQGNKDRYVWMSQNIPSEYLGVVMGMVKGQLDRVNDFVHRSVRPDANVW